MNPMDTVIFGPDPWWIVLIKVVMLFVVLLVWTIFNVWFERRVVGKMQNRLGPIMNGPLGLGQAVADGAKLMLKEDFRPDKTDKIVFNLAPFMMGVAAFTAWSVIPFGGEVTMFGHQTRLQLTDLPVATLFVIAIASMGIYGIVLAGWASNSTYSLLGSLRSAAQMISYEIAMGLSLVAVFMYAQSMSTSQIVEGQTARIIIFGWESAIPAWYGLILLPSFVIYSIAIVAETNRAPFDLPECESELVSGYITEYSGFRYAMFFLAEYINMATVSAMATTLFLGGWDFPFFDIDQGWWGALWFILKVQTFMFVFVWLRGTLPRFRYDQFMDIGWKYLIPISLGWIVIVAVVRGSQQFGLVQNASNLIIIIGVLALVLGLIMLLFSSSKSEPAIEDDDEFDAFAGGYPVPPMPGQQLPEFAGIVAGESSPGGKPTDTTTADGRDS